MEKEPCQLWEEAAKLAIRKGLKKMPSQRCPFDAANCCDGSSCAYLLETNDETDVNKLLLPEEQEILGGPQPKNPLKGFYERLKKTAKMQGL